MNKLTVKMSVMLIILAFISVSLIGQTLAEPPSNYADANAGTATNPYLISSLANLRWLSECPEDWWLGESTQVHFLQTADIDAGETADWNGGAGFRPIGYFVSLHPYSELWFVGGYDGGERTIANLHINQVGHVGADPEALGISVGLFGGVSNSTIKNVILENIDYTLTSDFEDVIGVFVGGVAGNVHTGSVVSNCHVMGSISGSGVNNTSAGGIAGFVGYVSTVEDCTANVGISCISTRRCDESSCFHSPIAGGIVGYMSFSYGTNSNILRSHSEGIIIADGEYCGIGGIAGYIFSNSNVSLCSATMRLEGNGRSSRVGGIAANAQFASVDKSFFSGVIRSNAIASSNNGGNSYVGGIIASHMASTITNCFSMGEMNSLGNRSSSAGGIAGELYGDYSTFTNCYSVAEINSVGTQFNRVGGLAGITNATSTISNSLWGLETTGVADAVGVLSGGTVTNSYGLPTEEMKLQSTYTDIGWDFVNIWDIDADYNEGYPYLRDIRPPVSEADVVVVKPQIATLLGNYPNPFNPSTTISFEVARKGAVSINVYNIKGQSVCVLADAVYDVGKHKVVWNGRDGAGHAVSSGVYFYQMRVEGYVETKKMVVVK